MRQNKRKETTVLKLLKEDMHLNIILWRIQDFRERGANRREGEGAPGYDFLKISRKLHEIKENHPRGACPLGPLRSATVMKQFINL